MRKLYHYYLENKRGLSKFLDEYEVPYDNSGNDAMYAFDLYKDQACYRKFRKQFPITSLNFMWRGVEYDNEEIAASEWLSVRCLNQKVNCAFYESTFEFSCPYRKLFSREQKYRHVRQAGELYASKAVKWKARQFFCGPNSCDYLIFCADKTKKILGEEWLGLEFWPVKRENHNTNIPDLYQLYFAQTLPIEAIHLTGKKRIKSCDNCGMKKIQIDSTNQLSLKREYLLNPKNVYTTGDILTFEKNDWNTFSLNIVSHEFYQFCEDNGMNRGMLYKPIKLV